MADIEDQQSAASPTPFRRVTIVNERGLHARASAKLVRCVEPFDAVVVVSKDRHSVRADSIMGLLTLAASKGSTLSLTATGAQAAEALDAVSSLIEAGFGEMG